MEKQYAVNTGYNESSLEGDHLAATNAFEARRGSKINEATDLYGDMQSAEEYGYVSRGLKSRHIQFIALGKLMLSHSG